MTVTLYHLCASMRARVSSRWRGFLDISVAGVRLKRLHSFHIKAKPESTLFIFHYSYFTLGTVARSVACKFASRSYDRSSRSTHSFVGSNFRLTLILAEQVVRYWRKNGHLILVNCL